MRDPRRSLASGLAIAALLAASVPAVAQSPSAGPSSDPGSATSGDVCAPFSAASAPAARARGPMGRALALRGAEVAEDPYACRLPEWDGGPAWPFAGTVDAAAAFHWSDAEGESVEPQGEIVGIGWAPVTLSKADAAKLVKAKAFATRGEPSKAIRQGRFLLVQIETAEEPRAGASRNLSFHIGTDRRNDPGNNAPASARFPANPYQDLQDVYTLYLAAGAPAPGLYSTDFAGKPDANGSTWYNATTPFAARVISDPPGVQFLLPAKAVGDSFRPLSFSDAEAQGVAGLLASVGGGDTPVRGTFDQGSDVPEVPTGSDFGAIGTRLGLFPRDGIADAMVGCLEADTIHLAPTVDGLAVDGVTQPTSLLLSQTPVIWCTWPTFADGDILAQWFNFADADGDGVTLVPATIVVVEESWDPQAGKSRRRELRQTTTIRVTLRGGNLYIGLVAGLGSYGYHDLQSIELGSTLNEDADRILRRSAEAALKVLPAWSVDETEGWTAGDATCLPGDVREPLGLPPR